MTIKYFAPPKYWKCRGSDDDWRPKHGVVKAIIWIPNSLF